MRVLVLHNAVYSERPDDLDTLEQVMQLRSYLRELGYEAAVAECHSLIDVERELQFYLPDKVFNLVESFSGSDENAYLVRGLIEAHRIPCTGCHAQALFLTGNKLLAKQIMTANGIPTPLLYTQEYADPLAKYIVKSASEHASLGMDAASVVNSCDEANLLIQAKQKQYGGSWFAEYYIEGREMNVALFADGENIRCLPVAEICFTGGGSINIVDYAAKWFEDSESCHHTVRRFLQTTEIKLSERLKEIALRCWNIFDLSGYARVDFRVDQQGNPFVLEINANPCLHANAGFMAAVSHAGLMPKQLINSLLGSTDHEYCCHSTISHCFE